MAESSNEEMSTSQQAGEEPEVGSTQEAESAGLSKAQLKRLKKKQAAGSAQADGVPAESAAAAPATPGGPPAAQEQQGVDGEAGGEDSGDEDNAAAEGGEVGGEGTAKKKKKKSEWGMGVCPVCCWRLSACLLLTQLPKVAFTVQHASCATCSASQDLQLRLPVQ